MTTSAFTPVRMLLLLVAWSCGNMIRAMAVPLGTGLNNTGVPSTGLNNTGVPSTGLNNTGVSSTGLNNTAVPSNGLNNTGLPGTGLNNTGVLMGTCLNNTGVPGTGLNNTGVSSTGLNNTGVSSTGLNNTAVPSNGLNNTGVHITNLNNTWVPVWTSMNNTGVPVVNENSLISWNSWILLNDQAALEHQKTINEAQISLDKIEEINQERYNKIEEINQERYQKSDENPSTVIGYFGDTLRVIGSILSIVAVAEPLLAPVSVITTATGTLLKVASTSYSETTTDNPIQNGNLEIRRELVEFQKGTNGKLLELKLQLNKMALSFNLEFNNMTKEIRSDNKFQIWFSFYTDWDYTIRNGADKLASTVDQMQSTNETTRLRAGQDFIDYYREQNVEGTAKKIFRLTTANTSTAPNILKLFIKNKGCDIMGLSNFMIMIFDISINYIIQASANDVLKGNGGHMVEQQIQDVNEQLYKGRKLYEELVWDCIRTSIKRAEETVKIYLIQHPRATGNQLTHGIYTKLRQIVPWYSWAVVQYENLVCSDEQSRPQSFDIPTRNLLVMWQDPDDTNFNCSDIDARNFVPFYPCSNCDTETLVAGDAFLSREECWWIETSVIIHSVLVCPSEMSQDISFLASGFKTPADPCEDRECSNHGTCVTIKDTSVWMCVCHRNYHGSDCERHFDPLMESRVVKLMNNMRQKLGTFLGVPDVISVYSELRNSRLQITSVKDSITSAIDSLDDSLRSAIDSLDNSLSSAIRFYGDLNLYGPDLITAEYITDEYKKLLAKEITEDTFYRFIEGHTDFDFKKFYWSLNKLFFGKGMVTLEEDISFHYKKLQAPYCTHDYKDKIQTFTKSILIVDELLSEVQAIKLTASLRHLETSIDRQEIWNDIDDIANNAINRQQGYLQHWENTSCPTLTEDTRIRQHHCDKYSSFEGLTVTLQCDKPLDVKPNIESVSCERKNGKLVWSSIPRCVEHEWGSWEAWSSCSKSCAGSWERTRIRRKPNNDTQTEAEACNDQEYCHERYHNSKDETTCSYVRVGQCIYLENELTKRALDGTSNQVYAAMTKCDDGDWHRSQCIHNITLKIAAQGRGPGDVIRHGDQVAFRVVMRGPYWIKQNYMTEVAECPGDTFNEDDWAACTSFMFTILSPLSRCPCNMTDTSSGCKGEPIQINDYVFLKEHGRDYYLTDLYNLAVSLDLECILDPSTCKSYMWRVRQIL